MDLRPAKPPVYGLWHYMVLAFVSVASVLAVPIGAVEDVLRCAFEGAVGARRGRTLGAWKDLQGAPYNIEHTTYSGCTAMCRCVAFGGLPWDSGCSGCLRRCTPGVDDLSKSFVAMTPGVRLDDALVTSADGPVG